MMMELFSALLAAVAVFVAVGALTGQFSATERRMAARTATLQRSPGSPEPGPTMRPVLLKQDEYSRSRALSSVLARFDWVPARARLLETADVPMKVGEYLIVVAVAAAAGGLLTGLASALPLVGVCGALLAIIAMELWLRARARRRIRVFDSQLPVALQIMATSLKSGFGIMEAVSTVAREMEAPLGLEFRRLIDQARVGGSFEDGVREMVGRVDSRDLRIVARALDVHRKVGGDLASILESVAATMREREELRGHILALTAQQRLGGIIVGLLPFWVVAFFLVTDPDFISPLWEEQVGRLLLAAGATMELLAFFAMRRIMTIEV